MIATDHDWRFDLAFLHQVVHGQPKLRTLAITQPADARRKPLELDALARQFNPAAQDAVFGKHLQNKIVGHSNVSGVATERHPAEWAAAFTKQRTDIRRYKARKIIGVLHTLLEGKRPDVVAVIKSDAAHLLQTQHALNVAGHRVH